ncbi:hypothetical protein MVEN_02344000 [Mycena venus]|uniref:Uncharacterized protein n=1 Tax=Mycena venus TaxID=2733690 RepID=A0A8H6X440_9AGAR|nr:hypothetical protein MVEN_02344000 [Mycena venus]
MASTLFSPLTSGFFIIFFSTLSTVMLRNGLWPGIHTIFRFGANTDGPRGLEYRAEPPSDDVEDPTTYGIDWDVADDSTLMTHLLDQNPQDWDEHNPFSPGQDALSHVPCDAPDAPSELTREHIAALDAELASTFDTSSRNMHVWRLVWMKAMEIFNQFYM